MDKISKTMIIIPARLASTRLKNKLLLEAAGKPVIQWVWESAVRAKLASKVIIAADSEEIYEKAKSFGASVEMTSKEHKSGSDRIAEVAKRHNEFEYILNMQGDEPQITPEIIDTALHAIHSSNSDISTLVRKITNKEQIESPNCVKCVFDKNFNALYFSRFPVPYPRNPEFASYYAHIGIYAYKRNSLLKMTSLEQADIEKTESLEQLRALYNGMKIRIAIVDLNPTGIDTIEDFNKFKAAAENV
ncbi:MAG: 3-deoxy-manno-octulosonate cytidylyltransferase [Candidatus Gastranaerophilales bacterium]|nr:3-deoxy-manno-octulosonate cytidylyltransferase [Candidatus Gastranaerophilales bacterium]